MLKKPVFAILALSLAAGAWAQEAEEEQVRREPAQQIRVLQHPYDIASFYRSSQGGDYFGYSDPLASRYPIASYYRSRQGGSFPGGYGYSAFWSGGYAAKHPGLSIGYRRSIGQNGDLFLFAPVFLAPIGPLAGAFGY